MIELDIALLKSINGLSVYGLDKVMMTISKTVIWIPLFVYIVWQLITTHGKKYGIYAVLFASLSVGVSDQVSTVFKDTVRRPRPSHTENLQDQLHYSKESQGSEYRGGNYGFYSAHASNFAALTLSFYSHYRGTTD